MTILITGGTGFIGRHLVRHLVDAGSEVALLVREQYHAGQPLPPDLAPLRPQLNLVYADLRNFQLTARALRQADPGVVIHLAAMGATDPFLAVNTALRHNLNGTLNLIRACFERRSGTKQLILARTPGEPAAMNVYAASKAAAWQFARMYSHTQGWPIHGAMIFQAYGPGQPATAVVPASAAAALAGESFPMTSGTQARDWIYVSDVAAGLAAAAGADLAPGTTFDLGSGQATAVIDVVKTIYELAGSSGRPRPGLLPDRPGEIPYQAADAARTAGLIGWRAATSLAQGLRQTLSHQAAQK